MGTETENTSMIVTRSRVKRPREDTPTSNPSSDKDYSPSNTEPKRGQLQRQKKNRANPTRDPPAKKTPKETRAKRSAPEQSTGGSSDHKTPPPLTKPKTARKPDTSKRPSTKKKVQFQENITVVGISPLKNNGNPSTQLPTARVAVEPRQPPSVLTSSVQVQAPSYQQSSIWTPRKEDIPTILPVGDPWTSADLIQLQLCSNFSSFSRHHKSAMDAILRLAPIKRPLSADTSSAVISAPLRAAERLFASMGVSASHRSVNLVHVSPGRHLPVIALGGVHFRNAVQYVDALVLDERNCLLKCSLPAALVKGSLSDQLCREMLREAGYEEYL